MLAEYLSKVVDQDNVLSIFKNHIQYQAIYIYIFQ